MIDQFGYDVANSPVDFFSKLHSWQNEEKPDEQTINTAENFLKLCETQPHSMLVFDKIIVFEWLYNTRWTQAEISGRLITTLTCKKSCQ